MDSDPLAAATVIVGLAAAVDSAAADAVAFGGNSLIASLALDLSFPRTVVILSVRFFVCLFQSQCAA